MNKPTITIYDGNTHETIQREMTDEEYADLIALGWTETAPEENTPE